MPAGLDPNDPYVRQMLLRAMGLDAASGNPVSAQGPFSPEISEFSYDLPSTLGGIPASMTSKGKVNPDSLETRQKTLNYGQDLTGSAGLGNNMLSWITGPQATDESAWTPIKKGTGSPLTFDNLASMQAMAQSGGSDYQSFMADQMLKGATPAGALAALKKTIRSGQASQDLLDSMPANYQSDAQAITGEKPDITSDQGFAQMYDTKTLLGDANDMHKGMAKDIALQKSAYRDPKTGQFYGGFEETPTEQMQAADKLGLAYPTKSYGDQDYIQQMQRQMLGSDDSADQFNLTNRPGMAKVAADAANQGYQGAADRTDELMKAWDAMQPKHVNPAQSLLGPGNPLRSINDMRGTMPGIGGMSNAEIQNLVGGAGNLSAVRPLQAGPRQLGIEGLVSGQRQPKTMADFMPKVDATGTRTVSGPQVLVGPDGTISLATNANKSKAFVPIVGSVDGGVVGQVNPGKQRSTYRPLSQGDVATSVKAKQAAAAAATDAQQAYYRSQFMNADEMSRAKLGAAMRYMAHQGRTPLNDQLAARSQTLRNLIGI